MDVSQASLTLEREKNSNEFFAGGSLSVCGYFCEKIYLCVCVCVYYVSGNIIPCKEGNLHMRTITHKKTLKY